MSQGAKQYVVRTYAMPRSLGVGFDEGKDVASKSSYENGRDANGNTHASLVAVANTYLLPLVMMIVDSFSFLYKPT